MEKLVKRFILGTAFLFLAQDSHALIEVRANGGLAIIDSAHFNNIISSQGVSAIYAVGVYGLDAIFRMPGTGLLLGVRHDWHGVKATSGSNEAEIASTRLAALAGYRWNIAGPLFMGFLGSYGLSHTPKVTTKFGGTSSSYDAGNGESASGAYEIGLHIGLIMFGAEVGMSSYLIKDIRNESTHAGYDLNLGSSYGRLYFGLGF